jgi:carboxylesterase type B
MFYGHGGGLSMGSAARVGQDDSNLAQANDVVVVQSNHRLGTWATYFVTNVKYGRRRCPHHAAEEESRPRHPRR